MGPVSGASALTPAHQLFVLEGTTAAMILISLLTKCLLVSVQPGGRSATETLGTTLPGTSGFNYLSVFPHVWDADKVPNGTETPRAE